MQYRILLVQYFDISRKLVSAILQENGYKVIEATGGSDAISSIEKEVPDLILLDIIMPGMDGYEVCRRLKKNPNTKDIPIIFLSGFDTPQGKIKALKLGGVDFINDIADKGEMIARIETHLKIKNLTQQLMDYNRQLTLKQKILDDDLKSAAMIQESLLPQKSLQLLNLQLSSTYLPCNPVGGDLFNIIPLPDNKIIFYVLDVSGHDITSAMVTVSVSQFLQQHSLYSDLQFSPKEMLTALEREYPYEKFDRFFTIFYFVLDPQTGRMSYSSAGHPPPVLLRHNRPYELLQTNGGLIGINHTDAFEEREIMLENGDKLILYTDGITEFYHHDTDLWGTKQFFSFLEKNKNEPVEILNDMIIKCLKGLEGSQSQLDDISLICLEYKPNKPTLSP